MDQPGLKLMSLGLLTLYLNIPGCTSLKEKRSRLKPFMARLRREFNISVAEIDRMDAWQETVVACALVSNNSSYTQRTLQQIVHWVESFWPDLSLFDDQIEIM
jgi:uncharacterized protein YlxP (DUF503 family)